MEQVIDQPISLDAVIGFLVTSPMFAALDAEERAEVVHIMEIQRLQPGEEVFHEGDAGDAWYVVFEGQVEVMAALASGGERRLTMLAVGAGFGEMALLDGAPRSATVRAVSPVTLFGFRRQRFEELLDQGSLGAYKLILAMAREMSPRLRRLTRQVAELLDAGPGDQPAGDAPVEVANLVERSRASE
ncbi:MAG: cyclic nucleotide-binding domain-containing protein [Acidimicrobiales bacterium]